MTSQSQKTHEIDCPRCNGKGYINGYSHNKGGVCFKCGGSGKVAATKRNIAAAEANKPCKLTMGKRIATELHIRAGYAHYMGYPEDDILEKIDLRNKEQWKIDFCHYLAEHISEWTALTA